VVCSSGPADQDVRVADLGADAEAHFLHGHKRPVAEQTHQDQPNVCDDALVRNAPTGRHSTGQRNNATMRLAATQNSTFDWRKLRLISDATKQR
jgi:hypothetical protein